MKVEHCVGSEGRSLDCAELTDEDCYLCDTYVQLLPVFSQLLGYYFI
jgi:hypothetical protein